MTFQEWMEGAGGEQARLTLNKPELLKNEIIILLLNQAYVAGEIAGLAEGKEIYDAN
jgi:hypothetical protein